METNEDFNAEIEQHKQALSTLHPCVAIGTCAKFRKGRLDGECLDLTTFKDYDEFEEFCFKMHNDETDPEFMCIAWKNAPKQLVGDKFPDRDMFWFLTTNWAGMTENDREAFELWLDEFYEPLQGDEDPNELYIKFGDKYEGCFDSGADFAEECADQLFETSVDDLPEPYCFHIDWEGVWRGLLDRGYRFQKGHVFRIR